MVFLSLTRKAAPKRDSPPLRYASPAGVDPYLRPVSPAQTGAPAPTCRTGFLFESPASRSKSHTAIDDTDHLLASGGLHPVDHTRVPDLFTGRI